MSRESASETETAILLRMSASRGALLAANRTPSSIRAARGNSREHAASTIVASLAGAPRVALVLALCAGAILPGPRQAIGIASRSGITAWLGRTARDVMLRAI
jgi:hypothetical protein